MKGQTLIAQATLDARRSRSNAQPTGTRNPKSQIPNPRWGRGWLRSRFLAILLAVSALGAEPDPRRDIVVAVVEQVMPSVVNIATEEIVEYRDPFAEMFQEFWGPHYRRRPRAARYSLGSGVIIDEEGYVLTNLHVVQRATKVWVQLADGREIEAQPIVGTTRRDVALLKLKGKAGEKFQAVPLARDDDLLLGETVLALGNPFGLGGSVSRGILSSKNRRPPLEGEALEIEDWLQTDAAINPGSSGGPLLNLRGELIGLNVAVYREGQGIGFAIPVKQVAEALSEIYTPEVQESLWFGARLRAGPAPLEVIAVQPGSPAEKAGVRVGDRVVRINGKAPRNSLHGTELVGAGAKNEATLDVRRGNDRKNLTVRLSSLTDLVRQKTGLTVQELTPELAGPLGLRPRSGLVIAEVDRGSPAAQARLQAGQVITGVGGGAVTSLLDLAAVLGEQKSGDLVEFRLLATQQRGFFSTVGEARVALRVR